MQQQQDLAAPLGYDCIKLCNEEIDDEFAFLEIDPSGRYGRYKQVLGKGAFKTVYKAFDEVEGIEVAWNQVKLQDILQSPEDLERLYSEVHLLKSLKHKNIIKFYSSWVDTKNNNVNFITEIFTSGNLRQYRKRHKHVDVRAIKHWARQILRGLLYLHSHDPPIIHRDLKCDNIFVNGNQGEVKIGDLGLAAILRHAHVHSVIGTPEFMAPELYEEEYNELVDIYSFGMCLLEMVTFEYPYSECMNAAQIYKKVTSGKKPAALNKVKDPNMRGFVEKCLATASRRLPARELLMDSFLQNETDIDNMYCVEWPPVASSGAFENDMEALEPNEEILFGGSEYKRLTSRRHLRSKSRDFTVKVRRRNDDTIFLRLRIADQQGRIRNIHFPFDVEADTPLGVASEMVSELDLSDQDVSTIANMIESEIVELVPEWKKEGVEQEEEEEEEEALGEEEEEEEEERRGEDVGSSEGTMSSSKASSNRDSSLGCGDPESQGTTMHGRFEEVTYHRSSHTKKREEEEEGEEPERVSNQSEEEESIEVELKLLASKQERELRELQFKHQQALLELKDHYYRFNK